MLPKRCHGAFIHNKTGAYNVGKIFRNLPTENIVALLACSASHCSVFSANNHLRFFCRRQRSAIIPTRNKLNYFVQKFRLWILLVSLITPIISIICSDHPPRDRIYQNVISVDNCSHAQWIVCRAKLFCCNEIVPYPKLFVNTLNR